MRVDVNQFQTAANNGEFIIPVPDGVKVKEKEAPKVEYLKEEDAQRYIWIMCSAFRVSPQDEMVKAIPLKEQTKISINQAFYKMKESETKEILGLTAPQAKNILDFGYSHLMPKTLDSDKKAYEQALKNYDSYMQSANSYLKSAVEIFQRIRATNNEAIDLRTVLSEVIKGGFYKIKSVQRDFISFVTVPVNCVDVRPKANVRRSVYLGEFEVKWEPRSARLYVLPHENNVKVSGIAHPHVGGSGDVCWGNATNVNKNLTNFNIKPVLEQLQTILTTYNDESPFRELGTFEDQRRIEEDRKNEKFLVWEDSAFIFRGNCYSNIIWDNYIVNNVEHDEDGNSNDDIIYVTIYYRESENDEFGEPTEYYLKRKDGTYQDVDEVCDSWETP